MKASDYNWCRCAHTEEAHDETFGWCQSDRCDCEAFLDKDSVEARAERLAKRLLNAYNLRGWRFRWNTTSKRTAGWCKPRERVIEVARWTLDKDWPWEEVKDVVLHEVAHALVRSRGGRASSHGPEWKEAAREVGADPTRCYDGDLPTVERLWRQYCPRCGWERRLHRLASAGSCPDCGIGTFNPNLLLYIEARDGRPVTSRIVLRTYTRYDALDRLPPGTEGL